VFGFGSPLTNDRAVQGDEFVDAAQRAEAAIWGGQPAQVAELTARS
jgi:hypothetical protein